jgi:hypothetical protein
MISPQTRGTRNGWAIEKHQKPSSITRPTLTTASIAVRATPRSVVGCVVMSDIGVPSRVRRPPLAGACLPARGRRRGPESSESVPASAAGLRAHVVPVDA